MGAGVGVVGVGVVVVGVVSVEGMVSVDDGAGAALLAAEITCHVPPKLAGSSITFQLSDQGCNAWATRTTRVTLAAVGRRRDLAAAGLLEIVRQGRVCGASEDGQAGAPLNDRRALF